MSIINCCIIFRTGVVDKTVRNTLRIPRCVLASSPQPDGLGGIGSSEKQVVGSLLVGVFLVGIKLTSAKDLVQIVERRKELKANLSLLRRMLEDKGLVDWLDDVEHDMSQRQGRVGEMASPSGRVYDAMENGAIAKCRGMIALFDSNSASATQLPHPATIARLETKQDAASNLVLGFAELEIRAPPLEIVAYILNLDSRFMESENAVDADLVCARVLETVNPHHRIWFNRYKARGVLDRTFLYSVIAKQVAEEPPTYVVAVVPIPSHDRMDPKDEARAVRGEVCRSFRLTEVAPGVTKYEYACSLDLKGWIPQSITNRVAIPQQMRNPELSQRYFQHIRPLSECDAEDGRVVGHLLAVLVEGNPKDLAHAVRTFVNRTAMLRECSFCHIGAMLVHMLAAADAQGSSNQAAIVAADPASVTEKQAMALGIAIASSVQQYHMPGTALHRVVTSHAALRAMKSRYVWFVPMLEVLTARKSTPSTETRRSTVIRRFSAIIAVDDASSAARVDATSNADGADAGRSFSFAVWRFAHLRSVHDSGPNTRPCGPETRPPPLRIPR
jgi:hypothetical protein